jgi:hypothetical protein
MRPWLRRAFGLTLVLSAVALWWPAEQLASVVGQAKSRSLAVEELGAGAADHSRQAAPLRRPLASAVLPGGLPRVVFDKAEFDPFVAVVAPTPTVAKPPPVTSAPPPVQPPPTVARQAPPQNYRYMGTLVDPSGRQWVYLARGDASVPVALGTQLDEGYVVEAIDPDGVRLLYAPMDARVVIPIPPPRSAPVR